MIVSEIQNPEKYVYKIVYVDTFTGVVIGAVRCGSFVGGDFGLLVASYEGIRWTRAFTWFRPPERNTLRPRVNGVVLLCLSVRLKSPGPFLCVYPDLL
jgi:hypothetical protein